MIKKYSFSVIVASILIFTSCSDDSTGPSGTDFGEASFDISGAIEGQKEGFADFRAFEMSGVYTWDILIIDEPPRTFEISFSQISLNEPISRPSTGTYKLGLGSDSDFSASYSEGSLARPDSYSAFGDYTGTLVITSSSDDIIEGTFEFEAINLDDIEEENVAEISISNGQFRAVPRQGGIN